MFPEIGRERGRPHDGGSVLQPSGVAADAPPMFAPLVDAASASLRARGKLLLAPILLPLVGFCVPEPVGQPWSAALVLLLPPALLVGFVAHPLPWADRATLRQLFGRALAELVPISLGVVAALIAAGGTASLRVAGASGADTMTLTAALGSPALAVDAVAGFTLWLMLAVCEAGRPGWRLLPLPVVSALALSAFAARPSGTRLHGADVIELLLGVDVAVLLLFALVRSVPGPHPARFGVYATLALPVPACFAALAVHFAADRLNDWRLTHLPGDLVLLAAGEDGERAILLRTPDLESRPWSAVPGERGGRAVLWNAGRYTPLDDVLIDDARLGDDGAYALHLVRATRGPPGWLIHLADGTTSLDDTPTVLEQYVRDADRAPADCVRLDAPLDSGKPTSGGARREFSTYGYREHRADGTRAAFTWSPGRDRTVAWDSTLLRPALTLCASRE